MSIGAENGVIMYLLALKVTPREHSLAWIRKDRFPSKESHFHHPTSPKGAILSDHFDRILVHIGIKHPQVSCTGSKGLARKLKRRAQKNAKNSPFSSKQSQTKANTGTHPLQQQNPNMASSISKTSITIAN